MVSALAALSCLGADNPVLRGALYFHFCLADRLTFDIATDLLWTLQQQGRDIINVAEVDIWSGRTLKKLASSVLSALPDLGRLAGGSKMRLVQPPLADELLVYVCKFLLAEGKTARGLLEAPDFRVWGLTLQEVGVRLAKLNQSGALRFEWSGDIAVLDLGEEPFDAYARRLGQEAH